MCEYAHPPSTYEQEGCYAHTIHIQPLHIWRRPSHHVNGNTVDRQGRLLCCEGSTRRLTRTEPDGTITVLADRYSGKRLNAPNDVTVKSDDTVWFTDNPSAITEEEIEQPRSYVFRLDPGATEPVVVIDDCAMPNGICFSPDESRLYVGDDAGDDHHLRVFTVQPDNTLCGRGFFARIDPGPTDGIRVDTAGNLFASAGDGIHVFSPEGVLLGRIHVPEAVTNCAFGGEGRTTLCIITRQCLYAIVLTTHGK